MYRLARYADDWVLAVSGTREQAEALCAQAAEVLSTMGLRLSPEKTLITHIDEGLDFLGWRIQRHRNARRQQVGGGIDPPRVLASISTRPNTSHDIKVLPDMSHPSVTRRGRSSLR